MENQRPTDPMIPSPEYWQGHSAEDDCAWRDNSGDPRTPFTGALKADSQGRKILKEFLNLADKEPIKALEAGEVFDPAQYGEGTVIQLHEERLDEPDFPLKDAWGVVTGYDRDGKRVKVLMRYWTSDTFTTPQFVKPGLEIREKITVGEVAHRRVVNTNGRFETIRKVDALKVYAYGQGIREKQKSELRLPNLGILRRNPQQG